MKRLALMIAPLLLLHGGATAVRATLIHDYELNGTYADSLGGPSLTPNGGTLGATGYTFGANQGPSLSGALTDPGNYAIEFGVSLDTTSGYRKLIDFKNLSSDNGLYNLSGALDFYPVANGPSGAIPQGQEVDILLTRDGTTGVVTGSVNGVQQFSFTDVNSYAVFSEPNNIIQFLQDDTQTHQTEASGGFLDYVRIYDSPSLTATPEPASLTLLLGLGLGGLTGYGWRRRKV